MLIRIISINNNEPKWIHESSKNYIQQLSKEIKIEIIQIKPNHLKDVEKKKFKDVENIKKYIKNFYIVALDENGHKFTSTKFAKKINILVQDYPRIAFVLGGVDGLDQYFIQKANLTLSLSPMTLTHQFAKVILIEQIFRAFSILKNHPYHRV